MRASVGDLSQKEEMQETVTTLIGMLLGLLLSRVLSDEPSTLPLVIMFALLTALHMWLNVKAVRALHLCSINRARAGILWDDFVGKAAGRRYVLTPASVAPIESLWAMRAEGILLGCTEMEWRAASSSDAAHSDYLVDNAVGFRCAYALSPRPQAVVRFDVDGRPSDTLTLRAYIHARARLARGPAPDDGDFDAFARSLASNGWDMSMILLEASLWSGGDVKKKNR